MKGDRKKLFWCGKLTMWTYFSFLVFVNKCKWTKLSCCHPPPLRFPAPRLSFPSLCVSEMHTHSLAQRRESVTMETRRQDSKSYLLRRELRQQKESTVWVAEKAATRTASIHFSLLFRGCVYHHQAAFSVFSHYYPAVSAFHQSV